jgi:hypothetical protein
LDATKERSEGVLMGVGIETVLADVLPVRMGFNTRNAAGPGVTAGLGWVHKNFGFDYAFVPYGDLGSAHRISVSWRWGEAPEGSRSHEYGWLGGDDPYFQMTGEALEAERPKRKSRPAPDSSPARKSPRPMR